MSVRRLDGTAGRSPDSPARRSRLAKRGHRQPAEERWRGGVGDTERFLPEGGGGGPLREGGLHPGTGSADSSSRTNSTSGWTPVGPRSASSRRRAMLRPKGRILYDSSEGVPGNPAKGTRLRSGGRCSGICQAAPRDYQAQSQITCSAEPTCEARPPTAGRGTLEGWRGRYRAVPPGGRRRGPASRRRSPSGDGFRRRFVADEFDFRLDAGRAEVRIPGSVRRFVAG